MCRGVSSTLVASRFHELADGDRSLTPLKLMKLVYIAHGWHLGIYGNSLIDEEVHAWQYGPVFPILYNKISKFGSGTVTKIDLKSKEKNVDLDNQEKELINAVWDGYGDLHAFDLSAMTHMDGTPWSKTRSKKGVGRGVVIEKELIQKYYEREKMNNAAQS